MRNAHVLVVDDHDAVRRSICGLLTNKYPGIDCLEAPNGEEAVELAAAHRPDLVLMDLELPGINGIEATRRVKTASPASRVVIVSIYDTAFHRADALAAGASAYISKSNLSFDLPPVLERLIEARVNGDDKK